MKKKLAEKGLEYKSGAEALSDKVIEEAAASAAASTEASAAGTGPSMSEKPIVGRLTNDRIQRLEALGFVWGLRDDWQRHYEELKQFKAENGHCNV